MRNIEISTLLFVVLFASNAKADCPKGVNLLRNGEKKNFDEVQDAVNEADEGDIIIVGEVDPQREIKIAGKKGLVLETDCAAVVGRIRIEKSKNIQIRKLVIEAHGGSGINLFSDVDANADISLSNLHIEGISMPNHGIEIGENSKNIVVRDSVVTNFFYQGIIVKENSKAILVDKSEIRNNLRNGILILGEAEVELVSNKIFGNGAAGIGGKDAGFGLLIQKPIRGYGPAKVKTIDNTMIFNIGALDKQFSSDVQGVTYLIQDQGNTTSSGLETPKMSAWNISVLQPINSETQKYIDAFSGNEKNFLTHYAYITILAMKGENLGASNYAFIREIQMDQCFYNLPDPKNIITTLIAKILGPSVKETVSFLARNSDADKNLGSKPIPAFCEEFHK